ncbi:contractile injection system protein, VgrG/Pvc8 family, partial [Burkholderia anthina]|uniref:contractile injection system protein, VgrG/Pvc8 family n=1 Tax=Burkholderia anthina TaxID=179879 RepID=UPI003C7C282D
MKYLPTGRSNRKKTRLGPYGNAVGQTTVLCGAGSPGRLRCSANRRGVAPSGASTTTESHRAALSAGALRARYSSPANSYRSYGGPSPQPVRITRDLSQKMTRPPLIASTAISDTPARAGVDIHQFYSLDIKGAPAAALADVYAFDGVCGIGEPTRYTIRFTHPRHDLSRSEFLNRIGAFVIQPPPRDRWSQPESARRVQGVVTGFALTATNRDQSMYEIVLESRLALLRNAPQCRFFLDKTFPEIIEQVLREHEFNQIFARFEFQLHRTYRKRS